MQHPYIVRAILYSRSTRMVNHAATDCTAVYERCNRADMYGMHSGGVRWRIWIVWWVQSAAP